MLGERNITLELDKYLKVRMDQAQGARTIEEYRK